MADLKKFFVNTLLLVLLSNVVSAANIGIIVEFEDGSVMTECVNVADNTQGYDVVERAVFDILWSPESIFGQLICRIEGEGTDVKGNFCEFFGDFWNFNILKGGDNEWMHSPVGHNGPGGCWNRKETSFAGHYCAVDRDVLGYKFGPGAEEPPFRAYGQVCEKLKVKDVKAFVDGRKESGVDENGGKIDVVPGSRIELRIELENLFTEEEDIGIKDISVEGTLEDIDDGRDIEDEANEFDLGAGRDKKIELRFGIPVEVEEDEFDLVVEITGRNERGFPYSKTIIFDVDVEKERHDVVFDSLGFLENNLQCGTQVILQLRAVNLGSNDENVKLTVSNKELGINIFESFELVQDPFDNENSFAKSYNILLPDAVNPGQYLFMGEMVYGDDIEQDIIGLNIGCKDVLQMGPKETKEDVKTNPMQARPETGHLLATGASIQSGTGTDDGGKNLLMIAVVAGEVILFIGAVVLLVFLLRR
jgi:hypothetical protein